MSEVNTFSYNELNTLNRNVEGQAIINPEIFKAQIEAGWKKRTLAVHYEIPEAQVTEICKALKVEIRKFKQKGYVIEGISPLVELETASTEVKGEAGVYEAAAVEEVQETVEITQEAPALDAYQEAPDMEAFGQEQMTNAFTAEVDETGSETAQEEVVENIPTKPTWNNG